MDKEINISKSEAQELLRKIKTAVENVCNEYNLSLEKINAKYNQESMDFSGKISWPVNGRSRIENNFLKYADDLNLKPEYLNQIFLIKKKRFKLIGLEPSRYSYPIKAINLNSKKIKYFNSEEILKAFN